MPQAVRHRIAAGCLVCFCEGPSKLAKETEPASRHSERLEYDQQAISGRTALLAAANLEFHQQCFEFNLANASCRLIRVDPFENTLPLLLETVADLCDFHLKHVDNAGGDVAVVEFFKIGIAADRLLPTRPAYASFLPSFDRRCFEGLFAFYRPSLRIDPTPAPPAT